MASSPIPVTVLTGFLGAGKTTLLNRVLAEPQGQRVAVMVDGIGEIGIDQELVIRSDEHVVEMNNGCICCSVRGDLIAAVGRLPRETPGFDRILIETTGLTDPAPVIQSFFVDEALRRSTRLDAIVTVVDAFHIEQHWNTGAALEQLAFADVLVLNKLDLATPESAARVEARVRSLNPLARLYRSVQSNVPLSAVLDVGAFDLARALRIAPELLVDTAHEHDPSVRSVALEREGSVDERALNRWLCEFAQANGPSLYRLKGIFSIRNARRRFVLQGVHMLLDGRPGAPWAAAERRVNRLVFIGKGLDEAQLRRSFDACFEAAELESLAS
jgi:G3E family GTPase